MRILADENIPCALDAFQCFGDVATMPGRVISPEHLNGVNALLVRSITRVDSALLESSSVEFVGTATSGMDHVDVDYLRARDIHFAHAQGANARSVAEYVLAAILECSGEAQMSSKTCAIVGYGHVGRAVYELLTALGTHCVAVDPLIDSPAEGPPLVTLEEAAKCDFLTFHVPLTDEGLHPTRHMLNTDLLAVLKHEAVVINAARGAIADSQALLQAKRRNPSLKLVLDTFAGEPHIDPDLVAAVDIATPHIAGYSWDAKLEGTRRIFDAMNDWQQTSRVFPVPHDSPAPAVATLSPCDSPSSLTSEVRHAIRQAYSIGSDDYGLRSGIESHAGNIGGIFDTLRKAYGPRREFGAIRFRSDEWSPEVSAILRELGFIAE